MKKKKFVDLFAGAGGFTLGFSLASLEPILSIEMDKFACQTIRNNFCHNVIEDDISKITNVKFVLNNVKETPDFIIGGPPCQGFSNAASNRAIDKNQRNLLPLTFLEWVKILEPKIFVIENVPGILSKKDTDGKFIIDKIKQFSTKINYHISIWKLNAADYGVPQNRNRVFLVGSRRFESIPIPPKTHQPKGLPLSLLNKHITVGEAILDLPEIYASEGEEVANYTLSPMNEYQKWARGNSNLVYNHVAMKHTRRMVKRYEAFMNGIKKLDDEIAVRKRGGNGELSTSSFNQNYRILKADMVSHTIPASFYSSFIHPTKPRNITAREAARLQSFPDYYEFKGKRTLVSNKLLKKMGKEDEIGLSQYNQVGNAVPPLLAKAIAEHLLNYV